MDIVIKSGYEQDFTDYSNGLDLPVCPVCGSKAFLSHDIHEGFDRGWSIGCPRVYNDEPHHGVNRRTDPDNRFSIYTMDSKEDCIDWWKERCERYTNEHK